MRIQIGLKIPFREQSLVDCLNQYVVKNKNWPSNL